MGPERRASRSEEVRGGWLRAKRAPCLHGLLALVLAFASLTSLGCNRGASHDTVRIGLIGHIDSVSPIYDRTPQAMIVESTLFRGFVQWTAKGALRPDWAAEVPSTASKTFRGNSKTASYSFRLRANATWSDGSPLTFDDFLFTYRALLHPLFRKGHEWWTAPIRGFTQAGDTLTFTIDRSVKHDGLDLFPLPRQILESTLNTDSLNFSGLPFHQTPVTDGPYRVKRRTYNSVELERNPQYTVHPPLIEHLLFRFYPTPEEALAALARNELDVVDQVPLENLATMPPSDAVQVGVTAGPRLVTLVFNTAKAPFNDVNVRLALAQAAERSTMVNTLGRLGAVATESWLQPTRLGYTPSFAAFEGSLEKARQYLGESHWRIDGGRLVPALPGAKGKSAPGPAEVRLLYDNESPDLQTAAASLQKSWQRLGLVVTLDGRPRASAVTDLHQGGFTVALQVMEVYPWTEPDTYFAEESIPTERNNFHGENVSGWTSKESQGLLKRISQEASPAAVPELVTAQEHLMAQEMPMLPLYFTPLATASRGNLGGLDPRTFGAITWNIEEWIWK